MKQKFIVYANDLVNIGDTVLLEQCLFALKDRFVDPDITVISWMRPDKSYQDNLERMGHRYVNIKSIYLVLLASIKSCVILGGGQHIRRNSSNLSLLILLAISAIAKSSGGHFAMIGCGADKNLGAIKLLLWKLIIIKHSIITARDKFSFEVIKKLDSSSKKLYLTEDLAFYPSYIHRFVDRLNNVPSIIISPCHDLRHNSQSEGRVVNSSAVSQLTIKLSSALNIDHIDLLAHDRRMTMDGNVCAEIASCINEYGSGFNINITKSGNSIDYISIYSRAEFVITNRLHAVIFALLYNKPIAVIDDGNEKLKSICREFFIPMIPVNVNKYDDTIRYMINKNSESIINERKLIVKNNCENSKKNFRLLISHLI